MPNQRRDRLSVTVTPEMRVALEQLAERSGLLLSTQATVVLRQGLARTISTEAVQAAVRRYKAARNHAAWQADTMAETAIERALGEVEGAGWATEVADEVEAEGRIGTVHAVAGEGMA